MQQPAYAAQSDAPIPFQFTGSGGEYFKIWIVNLCLTILTLGIYSAWAKVRRNRYFYGNTCVAGSAFDYQAKPIAILKGRLIAVAFFGAMSASQHFSMTLYGVLVLIFLVLLPWVMVRALTFRARYTAWRNIRFTFDGRYGEAFVNYVLISFLPLALIFVPSFFIVPGDPGSATRMFPIMGMGFVLMLAIGPYAFYRQKRWFVEHSGYGRDYFNFDATVGSFYKLAGMALLIMIGMGVVVGIVTSVSVVGSVARTGGQGAGMGAGVIRLMVTIYAVFILGYAYLFAYFKAKMANLLFGNTSIEGHSFVAELSVWGLFKVYLGNLIGIVFTLGLFIPWAKVRAARYIADHLWLAPNGDLDRFVAEQQSAVAAVGEEMGEMFDIDIGL